MNNPPEHLSRFTSFPTAAEAAIVVNALKEAGIEAVATGKMTANKQLGTGEWVDVLVNEHDVPVARNTLAKLREKSTEIDWSKIDVGEPGE